MSLQTLPLQEGLRVDRVAMQRLRLVKLVQSTLIKDLSLEWRMTKSALTRWSTEELETAILSRSLDNVQMYEAERILRERELAPDRKLARRIYISVAWTLAFALGTFVVALGIFWLIATGYRLP